MKNENKNTLIYIIIGIIIGVVIAPYFEVRPKHSQELVQYVQPAMGETLGEVIEVERIPGTELSAIKVFYIFETANNGRTEERVGAIVRNSDNIEIGDEVILLDVVYYNKQEGAPLWNRFLETRDFEPVDRR